MSSALLEGPLVSLNDEAYLIRALHKGVRRDGRGALELRTLQFSFDRGDGRASAECLLGHTR